MKRLGVIGTMVWDTVHRFHHHEPEEEWGGISFALAALDVALPDDWVIVPLIKVGRDLAPEIRSTLERIKDSLETQLGRHIQVGDV